MSENFVLDTYRIRGKKSAFFAIALILVLTLSTFIAVASIAHGQQSETICTYPHIGVIPSTVGVGQQIIVNFGVINLPPLFPNGTETVFHNYTVTIIEPDGTVQNMGPYNSEPEGLAFFAYTPSMIGNYTFEFFFGAQTDINGNNYLASNASTVLTVQQQPITTPTENPLPTGYWQRPINQENRLWSSISGNWLMPYYDPNSNTYNPYTTAPNSAHILWTDPLIFGGIVGGSSDLGYYSGGSYQAEFSPVIMNGRMYYNQRLGSSSWQGITCVDLQTGKQIWFDNGTTLAFGQLYNYESPNQHGVIPYLWSTVGSTYEMIDPNTGGWILNITNVPRGTRTFGSDGSLLIYTLNSAHNWLSLWNSSSIPAMLLGAIGTNAWQWRPPQGANIDGQTGIQWNVTVQAVPGSLGLQRADVEDGLVIAANTSVPSQMATQTTYAFAAYSIAPGHEGELLWTHEQVVSNSTSLDLTGARGTAIGDGVFTAWMKETMQWYGFSTLNGSLLWISQPYTFFWDQYAMGGGVIANGKFYTASYGGVHCFDVTTGKELWTFNNLNSGYNNPYGTYPFCSGSVGPSPVVTIADGKVYAVNNEHSPETPLFHGYKMYALNANTGTQLWNVTGWYENAAVADGSLVAFNEEDNQIYAFGRGQTAMTVTATPKVIATGSNVLIEGKVTDQSPGQTSLGIPAAGTPAISDKDMSAWMAYLYMQQPKPTDATGVSVVLTATDSSGSTQQIGSVTSDATGNYALAWTPPSQGVYTITASFAGSNSYYSSSAETHVDVGSASSAASPMPTSATPSPVTPPTQAPINETYMIVTAAVVIILVAAVAVILRRRR